MGTAAETVQQQRLVDPFGRAITYLRVSVTDRCNLRCKYCMPSEAPEWLERENLLTFEEITRLVAIASAEGVRKIRLTGGEPLVRRDLPRLVRMISELGTIRDLAMTTNGTLLARHARELREAGLHRLNVSLDSLRPDRFADITKSDTFHEVWAGVEAAIAAGFTPLKINMVVIRGFNDDEIVEFARLSRTMPVMVRFIEYMPIGGDREHWNRDHVVPIAEMRARIEQEEPLEQIEPEAATAGPERVYRLSGAGGRIGFITPVSDDFCARCNRVRLTADGRLRGCLMRDGETDFLSAFRAGATDHDIRNLLHQAISRKPEKHLINSPDFAYTTFYTMNRLGG